MRARPVEQVLRDLSQHQAVEDRRGAKPPCRAPRALNVVLAGHSLAAEEGQGGFGGIPRGFAAQLLGPVDSPHAKPASNSAAAGLHLMPGYPAAWDQRVQGIEVIRLGEVKVNAVQSRPESTGGSI